MVLANVPSFRFSFPGERPPKPPFWKPPFWKPPFCQHRKGAHWEIKGRFRKRVVLANVPSFRFSFRGNIHQNHPFGNHPFANPREGGLVVQYCAILRDYLSDTPLLRAMGFSMSQHGQLNAIPPPHFLSVSPLKSMPSAGAIPPPPQKGYLSDAGAIPYENKSNGCDTPLCDTISKGYCLIGGGGISHWAAKEVGRTREKACSCLRTT